mgnify:CR=1 FL=1
MFLDRCFFFQAEDGIRDLVRSRGLGDVYKRQGIVHPHLTGECQFLHPLGSEGDLVAPVVPHPVAVQQVVVVETLSAVGDGADEVLVEDHQIVVVDVHVLVHVPHEHGDALILHAAGLGAMDQLATHLGLLPVIHLAQRFGHEDGQEPLAARGVHVVENEREILEAVSYTHLMLPTSDLV